MPKVRFGGFAHTDHYADDLGKWLKGEVREVAGHHARRLVSDFATAGPKGAAGFAVVDRKGIDDPAPAPEVKQVARPPVDRMMNRPPIERRVARHRRSSYVR